MPTRPTPQGIPTTTVQPVRLTERLLRAGMSIKDDLTKAFTSWETHFRDPIKAALLAEPQSPVGEVTEKIVGGVRIYLAKTFPRDWFDTARMAAVLSRAMGPGGPSLTGDDIRMLIDTQALTIANPTAVANLLSTRLGVSAASFVIQPENPDVPSRVDLKWAAVPNREPVTGPLFDLPDRVVLAAAASSIGGPTIAVPPGTTANLRAAMAIDQANAALIQTEVAARPAPERDLQASPPVSAPRRRRAPRRAGR